MEKRRMLEYKEISQASHGKVDWILDQEACFGWEVVNIWYSYEDGPYPHQTKVLLTRSIERTEEEIKDLNYVPTPEEIMAGWQPKVWRQPK